MNGEVEKAIDELDLKYLEKTHQNKLREILKKRAKAICLDEDHIGKFNLFKAEIELEDDIPSFIPQRNLPQDEVKIVEENVKRLLKNQVIEESTSPYNSPITVVFSGKSPRMCVDARNINKKTLEYRAPYAKVEDCLNCLQGSTVFKFLRAAFGFKNSGNYFNQAMRMTLQGLGRKCCINWKT